MLGGGGHREVRNEGLWEGREGWWSGRDNGAGRAAQPLMESACENVADFAAEDEVADASDGGAGLYPVLGCADGVGEAGLWRGGWRVRAGSKVSGGKKLMIYNQYRHEGEIS